MDAEDQNSNSYSYRARIPVCKRITRIAVIDRARIPTIAVQEQPKNYSTYISVFRFFSLHKVLLKCPLTSSIVYKNRS